MYLHIDEKKKMQISNIMKINAVVLTIVVDRYNIKTTSLSDDGFNV